jgi:hypothetical protein
MSGRQLWVRLSAVGYRLSGVSLNARAGKVIDRNCNLFTHGFGRWAIIIGTQKLSRCLSTNKSRQPIADSRQSLHTPEPQIIRCAVCFAFASATGFVADAIVVAAQEGSAALDVFFEAGLVGIIAVYRPGRVG